MKSKVDTFEHRMRNEGSYEGGNSGTTARRAAHNQAAQSSIAAMSYGAWVDDEDYFRTGLGQWSITLDLTRDDGRVPIATRRGGRALYYHGCTISALVRIAKELVYKASTCTESHYGELVASIMRSHFS